MPGWPSRLHSEDDVFVNVTTWRHWLEAASKAPFPSRSWAGAQPPATVDPLGEPAAAGAEAARDGAAAERVAVECRGTGCDARRSVGLADAGVGVPVPEAVAGAVTEAVNEPVEVGVAAELRGAAPVQPVAAPATSPSASSGSGTGTDLRTE